MNTNDYRIGWRGETLACSLDNAAGGPAPSVLILHGGGPSSRKSTEYLARAVTSAGRSVIRFDHSGQGDSSGRIERSSLERRLDEAKAVLDYFGVSRDLVVIGSSMGGYIASRLVGEVGVASLVLFCPAAYSRDAWGVEFGSGFTEIIRTKDSFMSTDVGETLAGFRGAALLVMGTRDQVIPDAVVEIYKQALSQCGMFVTFAVEDCPHPIHRWVVTRPVVREQIERQVVALLV